MKKTVLLYGLVMAAIITFLKMIEYRYTIKKIDVDIYLGITAILFTGLGIWIGLQVLNRRDKRSINSTSQEVTQINFKRAEHLDLSERELEVLILLSDGLSNQEIADKLFISIHTVKTHCSNLFSKLNVKRRTQAIQKSKEMGLT